MASKAQLSFLLLSVVVASLAGPSAGVFHIVGAGKGWRIAPNQTYYADWARTRDIHVGDKLMFLYRSGVYDIVEVPTKALFDACSMDNVTMRYQLGPTIIKLTEPGPRYYFCGVGEHCEGGQKVAINVSADPAAPVGMPLTPPLAQLGSALPPPPLAQSGSALTPPETPVGMPPTPPMEQSGSALPPPATPVELSLTPPLADSGSALPPPATPAELPLTPPLADSGSALPPPPATPVELPLTPPLADSGSALPPPPEDSGSALPPPPATPLGLAVPPPPAPLVQPAKKKL